MDNPITEEIRAIRHELAAQFDNDLHRIVEDLQRQQRESGREFVQLPKRNIRPQTEKMECPIGDAPRRS